MGEILKIDGISVSYGSIRALSDVSMSVEEGAIVSLIGANGAGKSTLLNAIVGLVPLKEGSISFSGETICQTKHHGLTTDMIARKGIALVPEGRHVFSDMTVEENLDMGAFMVRDQELIARRKEEMYDFFPILGARRKQKTRSLSGGEQQMMAIARALMSGPRLLLLDEPGLGLAECKACAPLLELWLRAGERQDRAAGQRRGAPPEREGAEGIPRSLIWAAFGRLNASRCRGPSP